jgi:RNA polymerase sigma-70 factor (ECF subfamily)
VHVGENLPSESFEQLAMPHFERLYNFACWLTHDRQEAEDLVQETYAKALKGFPSFRPGTNFRAWIYKILRNAFLTSRTGLKATATVSLDLEDEEGALTVVEETPESILLQRSDGQLVLQALEQLPLVYREVLLLSEVERNVLPGNLCRSRHPNGYGDVASIPSQKSPTRWPTTTVCRKGELKW